MYSFHFQYYLPGIEGGFDVEQEQYEEEVNVVLLPERLEVTSEDLASMPDVVKERVSVALNRFVNHSSM